MDTVEASGPVMRQIDMRPNIGSLSLKVPEALQKNDGMTAAAVEIASCGRSRNASLRTVDITGV